MDNIINLYNDLPIDRINNSLSCIKTVIRLKESTADDIAGVVSDSVIAILANYGVFIDSEKVSPNDFLMLETAVRSMIYRYYGLDHDLHAISDDYFTDEDEPECEG